MKNLGILLLAVYLIVSGLTSFINLDSYGGGLILAILAAAAGIFLLVELRGKRIKAHIGTLLLSIWLIAKGLLPLLGIHFPGMDIIMALLAIAAGIFLLLKR